MTEDVTTSVIKIIGPTEEEEEPKDQVAPKVKISEQGDPGSIEEAALEATIPTAAPKALTQSGPEETDGIADMEVIYDDAAAESIGDALENALEQATTQEEPPRGESLASMTVPDLYSELLLAKGNELVTVAAVIVDREVSEIETEDAEKIIYTLTDRTKKAHGKDKVELARCLGKMVEVHGDEVAIAFMRDLIFNQDHELRIVAAETLARIGDEKSLGIMRIAAGVEERKDLGTKVQDALDLLEKTIEKRRTESSSLGSRTTRLERLPAKTIKEVRRRV